MDIFAEMIYRIYIGVSKRVDFDNLDIELADVSFEAVLAAQLR